MSTIDRGRSRILKGRGLIVGKYKWVHITLVVGVVFPSMNCNRDIIPTYSANLHNKTGENLMFLIASIFMNLGGGGGGVGFSPPH